MNIKFSLLFIVLVNFLVGCEGGKAQRTPVPFTLDSLAKHQGEFVKFRAQIVKVATQHPTGLLNRIDTNSGILIEKHEAYAVLNEGGHEIVLAADERITCSNLIEVQGTVKIIDLGGEPGTKMSYSRIWIDVSNYRCL